MNSRSIENDSNTKTRRGLEDCGGAPLSPRKIKLERKKNILIAEKVVLILGIVGIMSFSIFILGTTIELIKEFRQISSLRKTKDKTDEIILFIFEV